MNLNFPAIEFSISPCMMAGKNVERTQTDLSKNPGAIIVTALYCITLYVILYYHNQSIITFSLFQCYNIYFILLHKRLQSVITEISFWDQ